MLVPNQAISDGMSGFLLKASSPKPILDQAKANRGGQVLLPRCPRVIRSVDTPQGQG